MTLFGLKPVRLPVVSLLARIPAVVSVLVLVLAVSGCATVGGVAGVGDGKVPIGNISNLPQVTLPGASMENARSVAMAAALTKGWEIKASDANRLLLERPLPSDAPQAAALGSTLTPPRMQVETDLVERSDGTIVALKAFVLTNPGTAEEKRIDYTSEYENQLLISLSSLSSAWIAARDKVNSKVPVLAEAGGAGDQDADTSGSLGDAAATVAAAGSAGAQTAAASNQAATRSTAAPSPSVAAPAPAPVPAPAPAPAPVASSSLTPAPVAAPAPTAPSIGQVAPTIEAPASPTTAAEAAAPSALRPGPDPSGSVGMPAPIAPTAPADTAATNDMLVLNQGSRKGLWSYYAEDFARLRGCSVGDRGALLLQESDGYEVLEVECAGAANLLVKCRGGVCQSMR